ncbi:MAG: abfA3 [Firmicutes bacterium]|nr:abfA3 [Bacillota bacterium]
MNVDIRKKVNGRTKISKYIQGQFSEHLGRGIYEGIWVGKHSKISNTNGMRNDVVAALKKINVPVLRWPGGSFADEYHWEDGIGPNDQRRKIVNHSWGGVVEDNSFGTHEYFELCRQLGCDSYVNVNLGSGTIREMSDWIEYMTSSGESTMAQLRAKNGHPAPWKVKFLGLGNEAWLGGGSMRPEYYADVYRRFQTYIPEYNGPIYKIASGPSVDDYHWTDIVMKNTRGYLNGLSLHHYAMTDVWEKKGEAVNFQKDEWGRLLYNARKMDDLIANHLTHMGQYDPNHTTDLIVDEWGTWLKAEKGTNPAFLYQQNTIRDAIVAATTLNIFSKYAEHIKMANIAQMVNVLQAMIITYEDQMVLTPTYYVFDMYKYHQDAILVDAFSNNGEDINYTISMKNNEYIISVCNTSIVEEHNITITFGNSIQSPTYSKWIHSNIMNKHNTFDNPNNIIEEDFNHFTVKDTELFIRSDKMSVITIKIPITA